MRQNYWESGEVPKVVDSGKQRYKYYKQAGLIEICSVLVDGTEEKEVRRQVLSTYRLQKDVDLQNLILDFLFDSNLIRNADSEASLV